MQQTAERWKAEAAYITTFDARRTAFFVLTCPTPRNAAVRRAVFMEPDAEVQIAPVMGTDDLLKRCLRFGLSLSLTPSQ